MPARLRKLLGLDRRALRFLVVAQAALLRAQWRLRSAPIGAFVTKAGDAPMALSGDPELASSIALAIMRAAENGVFRPLCFARSLALREMLEAHGVRGSTIRIGVRRRAGTFQAHAWVRWGDTVLGDSVDHVSTFEEVDDMRVLG